jgi:hypothetical protein
MASGGYRPGSGAKKGTHRITAKELRDTIEFKLGMSYSEMLAESQVILFNNFKNGENIKEYLSFTENMCKRIVEHQLQEVSFSNPTDDLTNDEIQDRIKALMAKTAEDDNDAQDNNGDNDIKA